MNSCHVCSAVPKKELIISCDNCQNNYCFKCIKIHLNEPSIQKTFLICNFQTIKQKKKTKSWLCFACNKQCLCMPCKGNSLVSIEKQLLGKKQAISIKRKIQDFQKYLPQINIFNNMNLAQLSPFQQEYLMNKAMLYCGKNDSEVIRKKDIEQYEIKERTQRVEENKNVIQIDSEQNDDKHQQIEEQLNQDKVNPIQADQQNDAMDLQGGQNNDQDRRNPQVVGQAQNNEEQGKIVEGSRHDIVPEPAFHEVQPTLTVQNEQKAE